MQAKGINPDVGLIPATLPAKLTNDLHTWRFSVKLGLSALAMVNLELTRMKVFDHPAVVNGTGVPLEAKRFAIASIVLWTLAIIAGRLVEYPSFVQAWFGF